MMWGVATGPLRRGAAVGKAMHGVKCVSVGRLQQPFWVDAAEFYRQRLKPHLRLDEREVKDGSGKLPADKRSAEEGGRILAAMGPRDVGIALDERGKEYNSRGLAAFLEPFLEDANQQACFIVGGPFGLDKEVRKACRHSLRLGRLTLPHELARVVLLEQLYRAVSILKGLPYHHD